MSSLGNITRRNVLIDLLKVKLLKMSRRIHSKPPVEKDSSSSFEKHNPNRSPASKKDSKKPSKLLLQVSDREEFLTSEIELILDELKHHDDASENVKMLDRLKKLITTTTGFESLPKTLKILFGHYGNVKKLYEKKTDAAVKQRLASLVSFIATSQPDNSKGDILRYFLLGDQDQVNVWGIAYVRDLNQDIIEKWKVSSDQENKTTLGKLVARMAQYYIGQNSEIDACDLLMETDQLEILQSLITVDEVCVKVCRYITTCSPCLPEPENKNALYGVINLWLKFGHYVEALFVAIHLQCVSIIEKIFHLCQDVPLQKQMALILMRHNVTIDSHCAKPGVTELLANSLTSKHFIIVAKHLDVMAPKAPEEVIMPPKRRRKASHLRKPILPMSQIFMNGFINAAFGSDKLLTSEDDGASWIKQYKDLEIISAVGSLGLLYLWDVNSLSKIDKYLHSKEPCIKAGALLASGLVSCTAKCDFDPAFLLINEFVNNFSYEIQMGAIMGLGLAYVGSNHAKATKSILELLRNEKTNAFTVGLGALSCGLIANSSADGTLISCLIETLAVRFCDLSSKTARNIIYAIGLCAMGKVEMLPTLIEAIQVVPSEPVRKYLKLFIEICAYVGSSNILKVQELFQVCGQVHANQMKRAKSESKSKSPSSINGKRIVRKVRSNDTASVTENDNLMKMTAVLGIGLISIGDDMNSQMLMRNFGHLLQVDDEKLQSATILAIALMYLSNPQMNIIDKLTKFTHSENNNVASNAILALGMISAGTNNAKVAKILADLSYYPNRRQSVIQFSIGVAQGLLHMGKGTLTLNPLMEGRLVRHSSISGLLLLMMQLMQIESSLYQQHYSLFYLACAIRPKMMVTLDCETLEPIPVQVRVGQPVDTTGQAGKPRTVSGFQTYNTPVLLATNEAAELASEDFIPLSIHLEGFVLLKRKPNPNNPPKADNTTAESAAKKM